MKKLFLLLLVIFIAAISNAQIKLQKDRSLGYIPINDFPEANFTAAPEALKYSLSFDEAIVNPGKKILVDDSTKILKLKPLFKKQVEINKSYIVYNQQTNNIDFIEDTPKKEEESSGLILVSIASIFLMLISRVFSGDDLHCGSLITLAAFLAGIAAYLLFDSFVLDIAVVFAIILAFVAVVLAFLLAIMNTVSLIGKTNKVLRLIFYVLMSAHIVLMFA